MGPHNMMVKSCSVYVLYSGITFIKYETMRRNNIIPDQYKYWPTRILKPKQVPKSRHTDARIIPAFRNISRKKSVWYVSAEILRAK